MTEDGLIGLGAVVSTQKTKTMEKVEQAYKDVRGTNIEEFSANNEFDFGADDMSWF